MKRRWLILLMLAAVVAGGAVWQYARSTRGAGAATGLSETAAVSMEQKLAQILDRGVGQRHGTVYVSEDEINSYFGRRMGGRMPRGVYDVRLDLHQDRPSGTAVVDFEEIKAASKKPVNPLLDQILNGRKPITAAGRFTSANDQGIFHLEEVSIGGMTIRGALLDLLLRHFVLPRYPKVAIGRPFELPANIRQIAVEEGRARIEQ